MFQHTRRARSKYDTTGGAQYEDINAMAYEGSSYVRTCWFLKQEKNSALVFFTIFYLWKEKFAACSPFLRSDTFWHFSHFDHKIDHMTNGPHDGEKSERMRYREFHILVEKSRMCP